MKLQSQRICPIKILIRAALLSFKIVIPNYSSTSNVGVHTVPYIFTHIGEYVFDFTNLINKSSLSFEFPWSCEGCTSF